MSNALTLTLALRRQDIRPLAAAISCLFSLVAILTTPGLNDDAYGYLRAAELFDREGARAVLDNYGWYGYSLLIALLDRLLPGGALPAAYLLNTAAYALLVYVFITLAAEYRDRAEVRFFAAVTVLCFPLINEMRHSLIRDFGYWAFCLLALLQLIRYHREGEIRHALAWCLAMLTAIFFRLEGLVLLALAPLSLLLSPALPRQRRLRAWLTIQVILLASIALVLLVCLALGVDLPELMQYAYRYYLPRLLDLGRVLMETAGRLNESIFAAENFPGHTAYGLVVLLIAYTFTTAVDLIHALSPPLALLLLYGLLRRRLDLPVHAALPVAFFISASLLSLLIFMFIMNFLTQRYAALAALVLLSLLPLILDALLTEARARGRLRRFQWFFGVFVFYFLVDSLISFGYSKDYVREALAWTRENLREESALYTDSYAIAYYSGRVPDYDRISADPLVYVDRLQPGDYLIVEADHDDTRLRESLDARPGLELAAFFANERGDGVLIYQAAPSF